MKKKKIALIVIIGLIVSLTATGAAMAMTSDSYKIHWSMFTSGGGERSSTNYILTDMIDGSSATGQSESANYSLGSVFQFDASVTVCNPGDANGDGDINVLDMTKVARIILQLDSETPCADCNQDGSINVLDMTCIARKILGLD